MRKTILSAAIAAACLTPMLTSAQQAAAPASPHTVTGNVSLNSDYRFRGISQTYRQPALQGGIDYSHSSGLYLGNWNSNVASQVYLGGGGLEMDFYGGFKKSFGNLGLDVGYIYYYYPGADCNGNTGCTTFGSKKFDNQEIYGGLSWKWFSLKASYAVSDYFGLNKELASDYFLHRDTGAPLDAAGTRGKSKGTIYWDLSASIPVSDKLTLSAHVGKADIKNYGELDYTDWKVGVTYDLNGWLLGAAYVDTNAKPEWYYTGGSKGFKDTGDSTLVISIGKTF